MYNLQTRLVKCTSKKDKAKIKKTNGWLWNFYDLKLQAPSNTSIANVS